MSKLSELRTRVKLQVPNISGVDDSQIDAMLNKACDEVNLYCKQYKGYTDFNVVAEQMTYALSTNVPLYLGMDKKRIYFKNSSGQWKEITPKTKDWIEKTYPNWLNATSVAVPQWYWVEGDEIGFFPKPSTSYSSGARVYHLKKRTDMSDNDSYPFSGTTTEITALSMFDDALIAYCRWKLSPAVGAVTDADLRQREFLSECARAVKQSRRRPDLTSDPSYRIRI